jgi:hypothetical protein
MVYGLGFGV